MTKVTISDIARKLNLTPSTVSRALAGSPRVKGATRVLVENTARKMGYEQNILASNLRKGTAKIVGIIVPRINRQFFGNVISGAESVLNEAGYTVIICQTHEKLTNEIRALKTMRRNQVAGILISHSIESGDSSHILKEIGGSVRLVQFDRVYADLPGAKIVNDNFNGAYAATRHLIKSGYRKVGTLAGFMSSEHYRERLEGYRQAMLDAGRKVNERLIFPDSIVRETGYESAKEAIARGCDALYSAGDFSALGAVDAAREAGLDIPRDFGIVGTANESFTELMSPAMSSLELNPKELGRQASYAFLQGENVMSTDFRIVIPMKLIIRQSSLRNR